MHLKDPFCAWLTQIQLIYCQCVLLVPAGCTCTAGALVNACSCMMQGIFGLSNEQVQDLMFLRETYVLKECELKLQQAALTTCVQNHSPDPLLEVTRVANVGTELRVNAAQCHQLVQRLCGAMYFGVCCSPLR